VLGEMQFPRIFPARWPDMLILRSPRENSPCLWVI